MLRAGRDLKDHLVPGPCHEQGHLPLGLVAQSSIQPGLEHCQGGGSHSFSGQPVVVFHHPHGEDMPSNLISALAFVFCSVKNGKISFKQAVTFS